MRKQKIVIPMMYLEMSENKKKIQKIFLNIKSGEENVENVFKYAGEQFDKETQQYYLRARFYNPVVGRFTQEDIYRDDGLNLYVYVINNPLLWIDPSGLAKCNRVPEEITENRQREVDRYKVTDETANKTPKIKIGII